MVGTGVGDAAGSAFDGCRMTYTEVVEIVADELTYTDDTHIMLGIAESFIENEGFDGEQSSKTVQHRGIGGEAVRYRDSRVMKVMVAGL